MPITDLWMRDFPQQFQEKKNIGVLIRVFSKQFKEIQQVLEELKEKADIDTATGKQLDYVGTIVSLSRKEAGELVELGTEKPIMSDEQYRQFLKYKVLKNTNECTYNDLITAMNYIWDASNLLYKEESEYPATMILQAPRMDVEDEDVTFYRKICIKPAGVMVLLRKMLYTKAQEFMSAFSSLSINGDIHTRNLYIWNLLNGSFLIDGKYDLSGQRSTEIEWYPVLYEARGSITEQVKQEVSLKVEKNLWFLDGTASLDGNMELSAEIIEYEL